MVVNVVNVVRTDDGMSKAEAEQSFHGSGSGSGGTASVAALAHLL